MAAYGGVPQNVPVGLINQAATCYLDSLLQALYMTPEFRNAIYSLSEEDFSRQTKPKSVPYQLLKLFRQLKTSRTAVETKGITDCLGIKVSKQRDVQEFWHELYNILQQQLQGTLQGTQIERLYKGEIEDYVECQTCGKEESHKVAFLDVPLTVKPNAGQGEATLIRSLEDFVAPQFLDGEDASFCSDCEKTCAALKGLRFTRLPPILTLILMRYKMVEWSRHGQKLNDRLAFPEWMELGYLVNQDRTSSRSSGAQQPEDNTYELFAILLHYGNTTSGDYSAYIKQLDGSSQWYFFDDSVVIPIPEDRINDAFGEDTRPDKQRSYYSRSANAYMLMYRRRGRKGEESLTDESLLAHARKEMDGFKCSQPSGHQHGSSGTRSSISHSRGRDSKLQRREGDSTMSARRDSHLDEINRNVTSSHSAYDMGLNKTKNRNNLGTDNRQIGKHSAGESVTTSVRNYGQSVGAKERSADDATYSESMASGIFASAWNNSKPKVRQYKYDDSDEEYQLVPEPGNVNKNRPSADRAPRRGDSYEEDLKHQQQESDKMVNQLKEKQKNIAQRQRSLTAHSHQWQSDLQKETDREMQDIRDQEWKVKKSAAGRN